MRVTYYVAASLDGYIADESGSVDWLERAAAPGEDYGYTDFIADVDCLAMGRASWDFTESVGGHPYGARPIRVFTHRPLDPPREGATAVEGEPGPVVADLERAGHRHLWVVGGGELASAFIRAGLLTDLIVTVVPVTIGGGAGLFGPTPAAADFDLVGVSDFPAGLVQAHYRVRRASA